MDGKEQTECLQQLVWNKSHEQILKKIGEHCIVYEILHRKSSLYYLKQSRRFTVPVIILSTISGTLSFSMDSIPEIARNYVTFGIGFINIFVGIVSTISSLLLLSENYKLHFSAYSSFGKLARSISCKLELPPEDRSINGAEYVKEIRIEFENILSKSPTIPKKYIQKYKNKMSSHNNLYQPTIIKPVEIQIHEENKEEEEEKFII